jgi:hypothetical protein
MIFKTPRFTVYGTVGCTFEPCRVHVAKMSPFPKQGSRRATRHELDTLVVNIELTLGSIIQGVALSVLTESSRGPLGELRFDQWLYVFNGLLIILLFWSRSVAHTLTLIRWPLQFSHNFLYIACTLIEAITFTDLTDPLRWYAFNTVFAILAWSVFLVDLRIVLQRQEEARGPAERELYALIMKDQQLNIFLLIPGMILFHFAATATIYRWPEIFIQGNVHVGFAACQAAFLLGYLIYVLRFFSAIAPKILRADQEEATE